MNQTIHQTEQWYHQYGESVFRRCLRILGSEAAAWDATQEAFVRAHRGARAFRGDSSVLTWLLTIADRRCFTALKKGRREAVALDARIQESGPTSGRDVEDLLIRSDLVRHVLERAPRDVQQIVVLRFFDELEHEAIAARLGISRKTVHRKLERFYVQARRILGRQENPRPDGSR